ncbi:MAG: hypothetical protein WC693_03425 [Patescibacteria group bacterium]|jgi:hypothetical protein
MNKYLLGGILGISAIATLTGGVVYAQGNGNGSTNMLETKAEILGMTTEELSAARETKDYQEIALEQGVSIDEMNAQMEANAVARWQERGFSEEEIAERVAQRNELRETGEGPYSGGLGFGQGGNGQNNGAGNGSGNGTGDGECDLAS